MSKGKCFVIGIVHLLLVCFPMSSRAFSLAQLEGEVRVLGGCAPYFDKGIQKRKLPITKRCRLKVTVVGQDGGPVPDTSFKLQSISWNSDENIVSTSFTPSPDWQNLVVGTTNRRGFRKFRVKVSGSKILLELRAVPLQNFLKPIVEPVCQDTCGDGVCAEIVCLALGCPCAETRETCPADCRE